MYFVSLLAVGLMSCAVSGEGSGNGDGHPPSPPPTAIPYTNAGRWSVGEGDATASIQFDFLDGNSYVIDLSFTPPLTARAAFDKIKADATGFTFDFKYVSYSFGDFMTMYAIDGSSDEGDGSAPPHVDYWHYWTAEGDDAWAFSQVGASARNLVDGSRDGWVFGTSNTPAQVCEEMEVEACDMPKRENGRDCYAKCCKRRAGCTWNRVKRECLQTSCSVHPKLGTECGKRCCKKLHDADNCSWNKNTETCEEKAGACFTKRTQPGYRIP